jgi:hypothetical protein
MENLEARALIKRFLPPEDLEEAEQGQSKVRKIYATDLAYGGHMLLFVSLNRLQNALSYHPDKEDVFLIAAKKKTKPLYWVFGLEKYDAIQRKAKAGILERSDFVALEIPSNDPAMSFFTINDGTPHFEVTAIGPGSGPTFWVTEPDQLPVIAIDLEDFQIAVKNGREST